MPPPRSGRRADPRTLILGLVLFLGLILYLFSGSTDESKPESVASSILSPPSLPFRRLKKPTGRQVAPPVVHYHLNNITTSSNPVGNRETVLILTPLARFYQEYWDNILQLSYPHDLISLGFIIPKDAGGNAACKALQEQIARTQAGPVSKRFSSITILRQDFDAPLQSQDEAERHARVNQKARRAAMAKARNSLLFTTLGPSTSWVLWLDSDVTETPASLIQDLASHDKPIIVPNCFQRYFNNDKSAWDVRPYDYNTWIESDHARNMAAQMPKDEILLEGYADMATYRMLMVFMVDEGIEKDHKKEIQVDGVGGTALLVKADVHRDGAMFPPFAFYHLIETEGFAKMASRLGWKSWGLPNYFVSASRRCPDHTPAFVP